MYSRVIVIAVFKCEVPVAVRVVIEDFFCQMIGINTTLGTHYTTRDIIERRVNTAPYSRQTCLIGCIAIGGPLKRNIHAGPFLKKQKSAVGGNMELSHTTREIFITGKQRKCFCSRPRVRGMTGDIPGKRGRHECFSLIGHPVVGQHPSGTGVIGSGIGNRSETLPGV